MNAEQAENNFQSYLAHIRFREDRDRWPHLSEERLRERYEQLCIAGALLEKYRHKRYSSDEVIQGLPSLIAADMKKQRGQPPISKQVKPISVKAASRPIIQLKRRGHEPLDIKA